MYNLLVAFEEIDLIQETFEILDPMTGPNFVFACRRAGQYSADRLAYYQESV
jgi:hypothetical protein